MVVKESTVEKGQMERGLQVLVLVGGLERRTVGGLRSLGRKGLGVSMCTSM